MDATMLARWHQSSSGHGSDYQRRTGCDELFIKAAGLTHEIRLVDLGTVEQQDVIDWAWANCPSFRGMFAYESEFIDFDPEYYDFVFEQEKDAILFGLKFGSH